MVHNFQNLNLTKISIYLVFLLDELEVIVSEIGFKLIHSVFEEIYLLFFEICDSLDLGIAMISLRLCLFEFDIFFLKGKL